MSRDLVNQCAKNKLMESRRTNLILRIGQVTNETERRMSLDLCSDVGVASFRFFPNLATHTVFGVCSFKEWHSVGV